VEDKLREAQTKLAVLWTRFRSLLNRFVPTERQRLLLLTILSGALCGLAAVSFHVGISKAEAHLISHALAAPFHSWIYWTILTPAIGGLVVGLALEYWVPGAVGSGVPQVKVAYALASGYVPLRDAVGKFILGIIQIGTGSSLGREGPTVQICAGISSALARVSGLSKQSQRRMAALEEVVGDLDQTMLSGVIVAAAIAAVVERSVLGQHPVFEIQHPYSMGPPSSLVSYAILGLLSAVASVAFTDSLLGLRARFKKLSGVPKWVHPGIGGALTGTLAVVGMLWLKHNGITGGGYETLSQALTGSLPLKVMIGLCVLKLAATVCSYSSGGVGGIFAPALFIGGTLGGTVGYLDVVVFHHSTDSIGAFALVGMGAVFAGIIRAPMTSVLIIFEMTGGYGLILPLMIANMSAYGLARHWRGVPIYEALLLQDGVSLPHGKPVTPEESWPELLGESPP
jgi:CIC family chloride channel protein